MDVTALVVWFIPALSLDALLVSSGRSRILGRGFPSSVDVTYVVAGVGRHRPRTLLTKNVNSIATFLSAAMQLIETVILFDAYQDDAMYLLMTKEKLVENNWCFFSD